MGISVTENGITLTDVAETASREVKKRMCDNTRSVGVMSEARLVLIVMGVAGAGKTTVGRLLAEKLGWQFADADDFHLPENKDKISRGIPLTDANRAPWLVAMRNAILQWNAAGVNVVLACSALKRSYRAELRAGPVRFVYLKGDPALLLERLRSRHGHFADEKILASQLETLEAPPDDEPSDPQLSTITVTIDRGPEEIVAAIIAKLNVNG
jgi:gluconokinase